MKRNKKIMMSMGVIASMIVPAAIVATSAANLNENKSNAQGKSFIKNSFELNNMNIYANSVMQTPKAPVVDAPIKMIDGGKQLGKFIKEIDGVVYVGTANHGLMKLENNKLVPIIPGSTVNLEDGFIEKIGKTIYVGTTDQGLKKLENGKFKSITHKTNKNTNISPDETQVNQGFIKEIGKTIYVGTANKGLMKFENGELVPAALKNNGSEDKTNVQNGFIQEFNGIIYVGTNSEGLMKLENGQLKPALKKSDGSIDKTDVSGGFMKEIGNVLYVGTFNNGIMKLEKDLLVAAAKDKDGKADTSNISGGFINKIDKTIFIGSRGKGLRTLINEKITTIDDTNRYLFIEKINGVIYVGIDSNPIDPLHAGLAKLDFSSIAKINEGFIEKLFKSVKIQNQGKKTAKEIAKEIVDPVSLGKYSGIKIPQMKFSTLGKISASVNPVNGKIDVNIEVTTPYEKTKVIHGEIFDTNEEKQFKADQANKVKQGQISKNKNIASNTTQSNNKGFTILVLLTIMAGLSMAMAMISVFRKTK
ncbi:MAG: hypothetical protein HRT98_02860 [Mycoplasmatales bacterium]|nr:hypothetical protein [Mycoplasmatales bacterium]